MASTKKLVKKLIVTANLNSFSGDKKLQRIDDMALAQINNSGYVPNLNPAAQAVQKQVAAAKALITQRDTAVKAAQTLTGQVHDAETALVNIMVDQWTKQIQNAPGMDVNKVKALLFRTKGIDSGHVSTSTATEKQIIAASTPLIGKIDRNTTGQHTIHVKDSASKKLKLPAGVTRIDLYAQTGGTQPANLADLMTNGGGFIGTVDKKHHKYVNVFPAKSVSGTPEYYIAAYIDKTTLKPTAQSPVVMALLN